MAVVHGSSPCPTYVVLCFWSVLLFALGIFHSVTTGLPTPKLQVALDNFYSLKEEEVIYSVTCGALMSF